MEQKKIIIHFVPGSYGHFLEGLLCKVLEMPTEHRNDFHWINNPNIDIIDTTHDLEKQSENFIIKITYDENDVGLINRNKWEKWPYNFEQSKQEAFPNLNNINETTKEIVTKSYFKSFLLSDMNNWNKKINKETLEVPFNFFLLEKEKWLVEAMTIFKKCKIDCTVEYINNAYDIFQNTQKIILDAHKTNKLVEWSKKDILEKSNIIGSLYFNKHLKYNSPIPPSKVYSNTSEMLASWIKILDENNGVLKNN